MLAGVILLWFIEVALAVVFVAWDIRRTPEAAVMKWGFVVFTAYSGLFGALLYVLSCREPRPGTHEAYVAARWRQVVGSTMHCVAGDGLGILVAAAALAPLHLPPAVDLVVEYVVGFGFGWTIFQALFMRDMAGSYGRSLRNTFLPEMLSMNGVMAAMAAVSVPWKGAVAAATSPLNLDFWFVMSIALCAGFLVAYPINWLLVAKGLKHGMKTVRPDGTPAPLTAGLALAGATLARATHPGHNDEAVEDVSMDAPHGSGTPATDLRSHVMAGHAMRPSNHPRSASSRLELVTMTAASFALLAAGIVPAGLAGSLLGT
jgi:hypothetical protein